MSAYDIIFGLTLILQVLGWFCLWLVFVPGLPPRRAGDFRDTFPG